MKKVLIAVTILISLVPLLDLLHPGLPITHDGQDHVARIANFYQNLAEGVLVPRWAENLNWGYGHPILMFLYPFPSYFASLFHTVGFNFVDSTKLVFGISFLLSGLAMFLWINEFLGLYSGLIAGLLYLFAPYRFVDLYVRGAIGEHVIFMFPPLVCYFLLRATKSRSFFNIVGITLSLIGMILSHNAISLMFLPIIALYGLYLYIFNKKSISFLITSVVATVFAFGISAFFWIPAFFEGKYTLRDIVTGKETLERFVDLPKLFYSPWNYGISGEFSVQVGILQWIIVLLGFYLVYRFYRKKQHLWFLAAVSLFIFFFTIFLMLKDSTFIWLHISIMQKFQFPWRFLSITVFICAVLGGLFIFTLKKQWQSIIVLIVSGLLLIFNMQYWHAKGFLEKPESFYSGIYNSTTDTGESAPIWSVRFMEHRPKAHVEVISGHASIKEGLRKTTKRDYEITATTQSRIRENTLYFPGWVVMVDGQQVPIQFQDTQNRGLITFYIPQGQHHIQILFKETKLREISDFLSLFSILLLIIFGIIRKSHLWRRYRLF